jgi:hypothetical protein
MPGNRRRKRAVSGESVAFCASPSVTPSLFATLGQVLLDAEGSHRK